MAMMRASIVDEHTKDAMKVIPGTTAYSYCIEGASYFCIAGKVYCRDGIRATHQYYPVSSLKPIYLD
jgi:hypothetical protein